MDQGSNILSYPELEPIGNARPPRKYRKLKLTIYAIVLLILGFFVYSHFMKSNSPGLSEPQATSSNQTAPSPNADTPTSYWDKSKIAVPSYPPITSSTDLSESASQIDIPDFSDQITSLKELIAK